MSWLLTRLSRCKRCKAPCALQNDVEALALSETICPLKTWPSGAPGGRAVVTALPVFSTGTGSQAEQPESWGPPMWAELHSWALGCGQLSVAARQAWVRAFFARVPGGCSCRAHIAALEMIILPSLACCRATIFRATVAAHNAVNARLGKSELSFEAALQRWAAPAE